MLLVLKKILKRITIISSFCKKCGRSVADFEVRDSDWEKVKDASKIEGNVLCAHCFIKIANENNIRVRISNLNMLNNNKEKDEA